MNKPLTFRMYADIRFNRPIDKNADDYISPGGFTMTVSDKEIQFDFEDFEGSVDEHDPCLFHSVQRNPDYDTFADLYQISEDDLKNISEISEFFVFTGEIGETDLKPIAVESITFVLPYKDWDEIKVAKSVCENACICSNIQ